MKYKAKNDFYGEFEMDEVANTIYNLIDERTKYYNAECGNDDWYDDAHEEVNGLHATFNLMFETGHARIIDDSTSMRAKMFAEIQSTVNDVAGYPVDIRFV